VARPKKPSLADHYQAHVESRWRQASFVLRITEWKDAPVPVLAIKERQNSADGDEQVAGRSANQAGPRQRTLVERGHIVGEAQRRCLPVLRNIVSGVCDEKGVPLELQRYLTNEGLRLRANLPLDEEAGAKMALICKLQPRFLSSGSG
jgi:hypothetical protein